MEQSTRIVARLRHVLTPKGLDVVIPLSVESYNAFLERSAASAASDLTRFKLPVPPPRDASDGGEAPAPRSSSLLVLVGNSRALWQPFLEFVRREIALSGRVDPDPIDRYVQQSVHECLQALRDGDGGDDDGASSAASEEPEQVYWVADTEPGKMILAQKMALAAKLVAHCPPSQLCLHPVLGPWLAFRCALVFASDGIEPASDSDAQPPLCSHDDALHERVAALMDAAFAQARLTNGQGPVAPDAWRAWALPRIALAPDHPMAYSPEQILYHYTKDRAFLAKVVDARARNRSTDYLHSPPPPRAIACRQLLQQVLRECAARYPDGIDGILLSGGLDTSILAEASDQAWGDAADSALPPGELSLDKRGDARPILRFTHAFTLQAHSDATDAAFAARIFERLRGVSLERHHVLASSLEELLAHAPRVAGLLATCDPMELRNSLVIYATLAHAATLGVRHVVTGDAADEVFCGYAFYHGMDEPALQRYQAQIARVMQYTAPTLAAALGIEVVSPFRDPRVVAFALSLAKRDLVGERSPVPFDGAVHGKLVLRQAFPESFSQWRAKQPIEQGAGTTALRTGYFAARWSTQAFATRRREVFRQHRVVVRDNEHLFFFEAFADAFGHDMANVPRTRRVPVAGEGENEEEEADVAAGFCPACFFELSHPDQDFCVTCGCWPTTCTATNDAQGYATQALAQLAQDKRRLLAGDE
ncbi:hypothetical protein PybrP1_010865 [[Pythium] brassicae (nom. inval.)]|nr:hypothetical protein PybrP1_010865 [[Pythium] brassicae (nom. inval.)]